VYVDEAYQAMMTTQQFTLFDVERAEILKGPQGTLFGRNSTGGTVNFVTRKPSEKTDGFLDVSYSRFNNARVEGAFGGARSDRVNARAACLYNRSSPICRTATRVAGICGAMNPLPGARTSSSTSACVLSCCSRATAGARSDELPVAVERHDCRGQRERPGDQRNEGFPRRRGSASAGRRELRLRK
jgi:hypothetical protein